MQKLIKLIIYILDSFLVLKGIYELINHNQAMENVVGGLANHSYLIYLSLAILLFIGIAAFEFISRLKRERLKLEIKDSAIIYLLFKRRFSPRFDMVYGQAGIDLIVKLQMNEKADIRDFLLTNIQKYHQKKLMKF